MFEYPLDILVDAEDYAWSAHSGQVRKYTGEPYAKHCSAVANLLQAHGLPQYVCAAGVLHDVVEDTSVTEAELRRVFGDPIAQLVMEVTDVSRPEDGNRAARKRLDREHVAKASPEGQSIKLADLVDNTHSIVEHDPKFAQIYLAEKRALLKVLTKGKQSLRDLAYQTLHDAERKLSTELAA